MSTDLTGFLRMQGRRSPGVHLAAAAMRAETA